MRHLLGASGLALLLSIGALAGWRSFDGGGSRRSTTDAVLGLAAQPLAATASPTPRLWRAPLPIPITPAASIEYRAADPAFEPLPGARALYGVYSGGAYQIEVPDHWNGDVVYYAHGFRGNPPDLTVSAPALRQHFIEGGYAWAASSYSRNGFEPGAGARDTYALRQVFERRVGVPRHSYIYGESMGGNVVTYSLEHYPVAYDGGFTQCGVVSGPEELDYFVSWAALAQYLTGVRFIVDDMPSKEVESVLNSRVIPALGAPAAPSPAGQEFAGALMRLTGGERPFFREGFAENFQTNFMIIAHALELGGPSSAAGQNNDTVYTLASPSLAGQLNREIDRFVPAPLYRDAAAYVEFQPMTGRIERPLLTLHGTGDLFVPIGLEQSYREKVHAAGRDDLLVQRAVRRAGHCNFSLAEIQRGFDDLITWVEQGVRPAGEDLSGDLSRAGLSFTTPLEPNDPGGPAVVRP